MSDSNSAENKTSAESAVPGSEGGVAGFSGNAGEGPSVAQLQADLDRFRDLALRGQADFDNFRKRAAREREDAVKFANASLLERLIPIIDNFELGLGAARAEGEGSAVFKGMSMVLKQLGDFLSQHGVEAVEGEGTVFDPNMHEAIGQEESATVPDGSVVRQLRRGYRLRERLLRPAVVIISKGAPQGAE
jgi:molecular chaperone GrpE